MRGRRRVFGALDRRTRGAVSRAPARTAALAALGCGLVMAGCGGTRQDAGEPSGTFEMAIVRASFPASQSVARPAMLELQVRNSGTRALPNVAVTVDSFNYASDFQQLADDKRPIWAIERGPGATASPPVETQEVSSPGGDQTAYVNTWALGRLAPGQTRTFAWKVMPVKPGLHTVHFSFAAGLAGKAKAELAGGGPVQGQFTVSIAGKPPASHVNPSTGRVEAGAAPKSP